MRREGEIQQKLKQVTYRHLKKLLQSNFKKTPLRCLHNSKEALGCFCGHPNSKFRIFCDPSDPECLEQARSCSLWEARQTKETIKTEFQALMKGKLSEIAANYPDIAALRWVLQESGSESVDLPEIDEEEEEPLGKWDRFKRWIKFMR